MRAGYGVRYRVHGLDLSTTPFAVGIGSTGADGLPNSVVEFAREPHLKMINLETPVFLVRGSKEYPVRPRDGDLDGCYMTITVSAIYDVPQDLAARFADSGGSEETLNAVEELLAVRVREDLRPAAQLTASLAAARLQPAAAEHWLEFTAYWPSPAFYKARYASPATEAIDRLSANEELLTGLAEHIAIGSLEVSDLSRALEIAGYWYIAGRAAVAGSRERFLGLFQCLEALTNCAPQHPNAALDSALTKIASILEAVTDSATPTLLQALATVKQRVSRPVLAERFDRLLQFVAFPEAAETTKQFAAMNKIRNDLLHAHISQVPGEFRGYNVDRVLRSLAGDLLSAVADKIIAQIQGRGVRVKVVPTAPVAPAG